MKQENSIYIAGPMSGKVDHNYPAFHAAAKFLREKGWTVFSPAERLGMTVIFERVEQ